MGHSVGSRVSGRCDSLLVPPREFCLESYRPADAAILIDCAGHGDFSLESISFQKSRKSDRHDRTGARIVGSGER